VFAARSEDLALHGSGDDPEKCGVTADEIRAIPLEPFTNMSIETIKAMAAIDTAKILRELTAQMAELKIEVRLLCQVIEGK
jgi:hypothetical protein